MEIINEQMIITIRPGTRQWDGVIKKMALKEQSGVSML